MGILVSQSRYLPFGEVRWTGGAKTSDISYTSQRADSFGLMDYRARYYSPKLGRFISPDSIIPGASTSLAWDRYAGMMNNPVRYNDPSGHCIGPLFILCIQIAEVTLAWGTAHALGWVPDYRGVGIAEKYMDPQTDSIVIAAGIAVQSEWYGPWDTQQYAPNGVNSGLGIAQVSDSQMVHYGLAGQDQEDPSVAIQAMQARIGLVQDACTGCTARDKLIAAALAQNGSGFTEDSMRYVVNNYMNSGGYINWSGFFDEPRTPSDPVARLREKISGHQYDTQLMLLLFTKDLRKLYKNGWALPEGITEDDLDYMSDLSGSN